MSAPLPSVTPPILKTPRQRAEEQKQILHDTMTAASRALQATKGRVRRAYVEQLATTEYALTFRLEGQAALGRTVARVEV